VDYELVLDEPPVFEAPARVEFTGTLDPEARTIPATHVEYLSYPDVGERLTVDYDAETDPCTAAETGFSVTPDESFAFDGRVEIELTVDDGRPLGQVVDYRTIPVVGNTVPAKVDCGSTMATISQGYEIDLAEPSVATGTVGVEITDRDADRLSGRIEEYRLNYLEEGTRIRNHLKYQTERFVHDRETPEMEVVLEGQAPATGIYEVEITEIDDEIRGRIVDERDSLQTSTQGHSSSRDINRGVSSSVL
jgi:hypothetical protein